MKENEKERVFIHAMASPLAGIEMILESVIEDMVSAGDSNGYEERLKDVISGIEKMKTLLKERREEVLSVK